DYRYPTGEYHYAGETGDGVYRISPVGQPMDVYCNQSTEGGGWTLLMKQAKGDGITLQGDAIYWLTGQVLNDDPSGRNLNDGNFVSAAFGKLLASQFMLQASNESTVKIHSNSAPMTGLLAFGDGKTTIYADPAG